MNLSRSVHDGAYGLMGPRPSGLGPAWEGGGVETLDCERKKPSARLPHRAVQARHVLAQSWSIDVVQAGLPPGGATHAEASASPMASTSSSPGFRFRISGNSSTGALRFLRNATRYFATPAS